MGAKKNWFGQLKHVAKQERRVLLTSGAVTVLTFIIRLFGLLQSAELAAFDQLFRLRPPEAVDERILIVGIDEEDIENADAWPIPDQDMAELLQKLHSYQPSAIGLDVYRDLAVEPGHELLQETMTGIPNLIGIEKIEDLTETGVAAPEILQSKNMVGFNNVVLDSDGKVRRHLLYWHVGDEPRTSFALRLALIHLEKQGINPQPSKVNPDYLQLGQGVFYPVKRNSGSYVWLDQRGYQVLANFRDPHKFNRVKMRDVLNGRVDVKQVQDKIVLVGVTAPSVKDIFFTPYSSHLWGASEPIYGVELQANVVSQILSSALDGRPMIMVWADIWELICIFAWSIMGAIIVSRLRSPHRILQCFLLTGAILGGITYLAFLLGWWLPLLPSVLGLGGSAIVITAQIAHQQGELKRSKEFLRTIIDNIPDPVFVKDQQHRWMIINQAFCQFSGYGKYELLGKSELDVFPLDEAKVLRAQDESVFEHNQSQEDEATFTDAYNNTHRIATKRSLHQDGAGNVFLVGVIRDITERKHMEDQLRQLALDLSRDNTQLKRSATQLKHDAYHDELTGLGNRKLFLESLEQSLEWGEINGQFVGLLFVDLDGFKEVNDSLGHDLGDHLLKIIAKRMVNELRSSDIVSRLGGDEFTVILPGIKKLEYSSIVAEKLIKTISQVVSLGEKQANVTASIGISVYPNDGDNMDDLIRKADRAMYQAKEMGRNQYKFFKS